MKRLAVALLSTVAVAATFLSAQTKSTKPLEIYVVDVEGGKADLWVTPSGQTLLVDTGSPGARDADRIQEVMAAAGVTKIDNLLLTHYHVDHVGGLQELVKRLPPIAHFYDHGPTVEDGVDGHQREQVPDFQAWYASEYAKAQHTVLKPGDRIPLPGLDWRIVASAGKVIKTALPGGGQPNPECAAATRPDITRDPENAQSVGSVISFGQFRAADFGDMTSNIEYDLTCPNNPIGPVDMYFVSNHGIAGANAPEFVHALRPRVAVVQNGTRKGASIEMFDALRSSPGLEDIWELHWGYTGGVEYNSPGTFIANVETPESLATILTAPPRGAGGGRRGGGRPGGEAPGAGPAPAGAPPIAAPGAAAGGGNAAAAPEGRRGQGGPGGARGGRGGFGFGGGAAAHSPAYWIRDLRAA